MKKCLILLAALVACQTARAHFVWIVPNGDGTAKMVFSDTLDADDNVPITKIAQTIVTARSTSVKSIPVTKTAKDDHYLLTVPGNIAPGTEIGGVCTYGVLNKKGDPYLLAYYAKASLEPYSSPTPSVKAARSLPLEIVAVEGGKFAVLWNGKATADVEVVALAPKGDAASKKISVEKDGTFAIQGLHTSPGMVGLRARFIEKKAGELDGKKYAEIRHYTTWTFKVAVRAK